MYPDKGSKNNACLNSLHVTFWIKYHKRHGVRKKQHENLVRVQGGIKVSSKSCVVYVVVVILKQSLLQKNKKLKKQKGCWNPVKRMHACTLENNPPPREEKTTRAIARNKRGTRVYNYAPGIITSRSVGYKITELLFDMAKLPEVKLCFLVAQNFIYISFFSLENYAAALRCWRRTICMRIIYVRGFLNLSVLDLFDDLHTELGLVAGVLGLVTKNLEFLGLIWIVKKKCFICVFMHAKVEFLKLYRELCRAQKFDLSNGQKFRKHKHRAAKINFTSRTLKRQTLVLFNLKRITPVI